MTNRRSVGVAKMGSLEKDVKSLIRKNYDYHLNITLEKCVGVLGDLNSKITFLFPSALLQLLLSCSPVFPSPAPFIHFGCPSLSGREQIMMLHHRDYGDYRWCHWCNQPRKTSRLYGGADSCPLHH